LQSSGGTVGAERREYEMREKIKNSEKLRDRILSDEKLLRDLSERIADDT